MGDPADFTVVELGAGRGEMAEALGEFRYIPVELRSGKLPRDIRGVVFSNEFFDALPVHAAICDRRHAARVAGRRGGRPRSSGWTASRAAASVE